MNPIRALHAEKIAQAVLLYAYTIVFPASLLPKKEEKKKKEKKKSQKTLQGFMSDCPVNAVHKRKKEKKRLIGQI